MDLVLSHNINKTSLIPEKTNNDESERNTEWNRIIEESEKNITLKWVPAQQTTEKEARKQKDDKDYLLSNKIREAYKRKANILNIKRTKVFKINPVPNLAMAKNKKITIKHDTTALNTEKENRLLEENKKLKQQVQELLNKFKEKEKNEDKINITVSTHKIDSKYSNRRVKTQLWR